MPGERPCPCTLRTIPEKPSLYRYECAPEAFRVRMPRSRRQISPARSLPETSFRFPLSHSLNQPQRIGVKLQSRFMIARVNGHQSPVNIRVRRRWKSSKLIYHLEFV